MAESEYGFVCGQAQAQFIHCGVCVYEVGGENTQVIMILVSCSTLGQYYISISGVGLIPRRLGTRLQWNEG